MKNGKEEEAMALVALIVNIMAKVSLLLDSVMPEKISKIALSLGITIDTNTYKNLVINKGIVEDTTITKIDALFPRIEEELIATAEIQKTEAVVEKPRKESLNKEKMLESRPSVAGVRYQQKEEFFVKPKKISTPTKTLTRTVDK